MSIGWGLGVATAIGLAGWMAVGCARAFGQEPTDWIEVDGTSPKRADKVVRTDAEWKARLSAEAYGILRRKGTEPAFCSPWHDQKRPGQYVCGGCDLPLFEGQDKFVSGTGWPSFFRPTIGKNVWTRMDGSIPSMPRVEVLCSRCDGHLGHVFPDGPKPTSLRYCINAQAMKFVPSDAATPPKPKPKR